MDLTGQQVKVMLQIGRTDSDVEVVPAEVIAELVKLGLLYKRHDGHLDFTDVGEDVYDELAGES